MNVVTIDKEQPEQCNQRCSESDDGPGNEESDDAIDADPGKTSSSNASGSGLLTKKKDQVSNMEFLWIYQRKPCAMRTSFVSNV